MRTILAKTAGFCYGVNRAVKLVEQTAASGEPVVTLGPIIHNHHVVSAFEEKDVREIDEVSAVPDGCIVVIRSHGVSRAVMQELAQRGLRVIDATCPFVERIHTLVEQADRDGRRVIILGVRSHPEVTAIAGWCSDPLIFESAEEVDAWRAAPEFLPDTPYTVVCQTTSTQKLWSSCTKILKKECTNCEIFDTICNATDNRQKEAQSLSAACDGMIVVGDENSSNTKRLAEICRASCKTVALIDNARELKPELFTQGNTVGITAGASTPAWIIKEVYNIMSDETKIDAAEESQSFAELLEQSIKTLNTGEKVTGVVTSITPTEIYVDLGTKHAGYIPYSEVSDDPSVKPEEMFKVGDEIEVIVVRVNDVEGTVMLSRKRVDADKKWEDVVAAEADKTILEAVITEQNKGGVVANYKGVRVFIPASQTGIPKNGDMGTLVKQKVRIRITEVNRARRRVVGSIRAVASEERKAASEKIWSEIEVGKKYQGVVKSLTSYGAFVDIGGVDGMVHVSELSWSRIKSPADVVKIGDQIEVYVISFDPEKKKISLGYKTTENNPWNVFLDQYKVGDVVKAKVVKLMTFGAFAEIIPGVDGLIHISQIADRRIAKPEDALSEGQEVDVKIIDINTEGKRISLSIRALLTGEDEEQE